MTPEYWQRVKSILDSALALPVNAREGFVARACAHDAEMLDDVKQYLACHSLAEILLPESGPRALRVSFGDADPYELPKRIGPYRIIREIGRGGMGVVYLAERDDGEFHRLVALKLVQREMSTGTLAKLFRREREILAQLEHPNIARLLDGGTTESGQSYFAMDYIDGEPLLSYCSRRQLNIRQKLELFLLVCSAVSYAHRKLIIHRDLKPGNILVTPDGTPKLLDFGLAKILDRDRALAVTIDGLRLTPHYASPEQLRKEALTVGADIYSLGVVLYELLTGRLPYGQAEGPVETLRAVLEVPPQPLSAPGQPVPADLENIVMMALRKEPERRYPTVDAFSEDIRRYLDGFPVHAAPESLRYRAAKFATRHKLMISAALVALMTLISAASMIWREKREADTRYDQVRRLANSIVFEMHDAIESLPGSTAARKLLIARALDYLNALAAGHKRDFATTFELAQAYERLGDAQGSASSANLGDRAEALENYRRARSLLLELRRNQPGNTDVERVLGQVDEEIAAVLPPSQVNRILEARKEAVALLADVARKTSGIQALRDLAFAHYELAFDKTSREDFRGALPDWSQALSDYSRLEQLRPGGNALRNVALVQKRIAGVYYALGDCPNSIVHDRAAAAIDERRVSANPRNPAAQMDLSFDLVELGWCLSKTGQREEAASVLARALAIRRSLAAADPFDFRAQAELETALRVFGIIRYESGDLERGLALEEQAVALGKQLVQRNPGNQRELANLALDYAHLGAVQSRRELWRAALANFQTARRLASELPAQALDDPNDRRTLAELVSKAAEALARVRGGSSVLRHVRF